MSEATRHPEDMILGVRREQVLERRVKELETENDGLKKWRHIASNLVDENEALKKERDCWKGDYRSQIIVIDEKLLEVKKLEQQVEELKKQHEEDKAWWMAKAKELKARVTP